MKRGRRLIALLLAAVMIATADTSVYQVFGQDAQDGGALSESTAGGGTDAGTDSAVDTGADESGSVSAGQTDSGQTDNSEADTQTGAVSLGSADTAGSAPDGAENSGVQNTGSDSISTYSAPAENPDAGVKTAAESTPLNFDIEAEVSLPDLSLYSGESFYYTLKYTVPPLETGNDFLTPLFKLELPENVLPVPTPQGKDDVTGPDVKYTSVRDGANGTKILYIYLNTKLNVGKTSNIVIHLRTTNFKMANKTQIKMSPEFAATANAIPVTGSIPEAQKPVITVKTDDVWTVSKSVGEVQTKDTYYEVPYAIEVKNTNAAGDAGWDRNGRLDIENYVLTDILPTLASPDAPYEGCPAGGRASEVASVSMGGQTLKADEDYSVIRAADGTVDRISINKYGAATAGQAEQSEYITEGSPVTTQYTIRLRYPRSPYVTPANEKPKRWNLTNTADLSYRLLGETDTGSQDTAVIKLGEKAEAGKAQKLTVQKIAQIGDRTFPIGENNGAGEYGNAKFTLYQEEDGQKVLANNITGEKVVGGERETDKNGQVTFSDLGEGTYYLRETEFLKNFAQISDDKYIKLQLDSTGKVTVSGWNGYQGQVDGNTLKIVNTTDTLGIVEFYKHGTNADNQDEVLGGVTFQLVNKDNKKEYDAVSAGDGLVRFHLIPAGTYWLKEVSVGANSDYEAPAGYIQDGGGNLEISVRGNDIVKPIFGETDVDGNPVLRNESPKGRLMIRKVNEVLGDADVKLGLAGAKFELYGPYDQSKTTIAQGDVPVKYNGQTYQLVTKDQGYATSIPLKEGYYLLKEVEAPSGYSILHEVTQVKVVAKSTTPDDQIPEIENERKIRFTIKKTGVLGNGLYEEPLAGAVFNIYDKGTGGKLLGTLTTKIELGASTSNELELKPGTYWWEEMTAPEGYAKQTGRHAFTVDKNDTDSWQLKIKDTAVWGQMKLVKEDSFDHTKLAGVTFGIYEDQACTNKYMKAAGQHVTMTTDKDGVALSPLLPHRELGYYVKELPMQGSDTESLPGYQLSDKVYGPVMIVADKQVSVTGDDSAISNDKQSGIRIIKKDSHTGQGLGGVQFELYGSDGTSLIETKTTGNDGTVTFDGLKPNTTYYYREKKVPDGYAGDTEKKAVTTPDYKSTNQTTAEVEVDNYRKGALDIYKYTDMDAGSSRSPMAGVKFQVYWAERDTPCVADDAHFLSLTKATDANGYVQIGGLDPQKDYYLKEVLPPDEAGGYNPGILGPYKVSEGNGQTGYDKDAPVEIENKAVKGKLEIEKISSINNEDGTVKHLRASFDIYKGHAASEDQLSSLPKVGTVTTDAATGRVTSGWLEPGEYTLQETSVEEEYTKDSTLHYVTVEAKKTNQALTGDNAIPNVPQGKIQVNKKAVYTVVKNGAAAGETSEYPLSDMLFYIYRSTGTANKDADLSRDPVESVSGDNPFDADGTWVSKALDEGTYWIKEVVPEKYKDQYNALPPFEVKVEAGKTTVAKTGGEHGKDGESVLNPSNYGKFRLFKRDKMTGTLLDEAIFEVYVVSADGESYETEGGPAGVLLKKAEGVSSSTNGGGNIMVSGTSGTGQAVSVALKPGQTYYLRETAAPPGYEYENAWTGPITVEKGKETWVDIDNYKPSYPEGVKQDSAGRPLKGAYIGVFNSQADAERARAWLASLRVGTGEENRTDVINEINDLANRTAYGILGVGISGANGEFQFDRKLIPGTTYYIMELLPPAGYLWEQTIISKKLVADKDGNGVWEGGLAIQNRESSQIKVFKYTTLTDSSEEYGVEGVNFFVYKAVADPSGLYADAQGVTYRKESNTEVAKGTSQRDGYYISIYLDAGTYIIEEDTLNLPDTVTKGTDLYKIVTIGNGEKKDKTDKTKTDAKFYNPSKWSKFLIRKVDQDHTGKSLSAKFKLERFEGGTWSDYKVAPEAGTYTVTTKTDGTYTTSVFLPVGHYRLTETGIPSGYTGLAAPIEFDIVSGKATYIKYGEVAENSDGTVNNDVVTNAEKGSLEIQKYGYYQEDGTTNLENRENLKGIKFQLYKTTQTGTEADIKEANVVRNKDISPGAANPNAAKVITTGNNGSIRTNGLDAGYYWLKETVGTNKYPVLAAPVKIEIRRGQTTSCTGDDSIKNITNYGKIRIKKVDPANGDTGVGGAVFGVYKDSGCTQRTTTMTTDSAGIATSIAIPAGQYYVKEITAPAGYKLDETSQPALVTEKKTTDLSTTPFKNSKVFRIRFTKESLNGEKLKEATFALYDTEAKAQAGTMGNTDTALCYGETDASGTWTTSELTLTQSPTTYYLRELVAPKGYALSDDIHEITVTYQDIKSANQTLTGLANTTVKDVPLGTMRIRKLGRWKGIEDTDLREISLNGVKFTLYKVSGENVNHSAHDPAAAELETGKTGEDGVAESAGLESGWYEVVETVPDGFDRNTAVPHWVEIKDNQRNDKLYNDPVVNKPDKGQFWLYKFDGREGDSESELRGLAKAEFVLYRWDKSLGKYVFAADNKEKSTLTMDTETYESGYWEPGDYRLIESKAPEPVDITVGGTTYTVEFELDQTPIDFHIEVGTTVKIVAHNSPKGSIELTKTGDSFNQFEPISNAKFRLLDQDKNVIADTEIASGTNGVYRWEKINPGTYYIEEMDSKAVTDAGYSINKELIKVVVPAGIKVNAIEESEDLAVLTTTARMENASDKGRLRILKRGESDKEELTGAKFEIYAKKNDGTWEATPIDTVTVNDKSGTLSKLLPASKLGTIYLVKEVTAPNGYTLDGTLSAYPLTKEVTLYPHHNPEAGASAGANTVTFYNKKIGSIAGFDAGIKKSIRENPSDVEADETEYGTETNAPQSLLLSDYNVDYKIGGYASGNNEIGAKTFTVTDNDITLYYLAPDGSYQPVTGSGQLALPGKADAHPDYQMNSLTLLPAQNAKEPEKIVGAKVYVQYTREQKNLNQWTQLATEIPSLAAESRIDLSDGGKKVIGIKVEYQNVGKGFQTEGIVVNTTFLNRGGWSGSTDHEVRKIINRAALSWEDLRVNNEGKEDHNHAAVKSNEVASIIPTYKAKIPKVKIANEVTGRKATYFAGDTVDYRVTVTNEAVDNQDENFRQPVVSVKLPAFTELDEQSDKVGAVEGFYIYKMSKGVRTLIPANLYRRSMVMATSALSPADPGGSATDPGREDLATAMYTFEFVEDPLTTLAEDESIVIEFGGYITYDRTKEIGNLVSPAYLSSNALIPKSFENPKGLSFETSSEGQPVVDTIKDNQIINDQVVGKDLSYLNDTVDVPVSDSTAIAITKSVSADGQKYGTKATARVNPEGTIYYEITLVNNSTDKIKKASIVDVLPVTGDAYIVPISKSGNADNDFQGRKTDIPAGLGDAKVAYQDIRGEDSVGEATFYYYDNTGDGWTKAERNAIAETESNGRIAMLYDNRKMTDWETLGWTKGKPGENSGATAVGAQIDFTKNGGGGLESGGTYTINLEVKAPGYTADQIQDYNGKLMANSAAAAVMRTGVGDGPVGQDDRVEAPQVLATMALPTGSIGDYVWLDKNSNGIQDDDGDGSDAQKSGLEGIGVTLEKTTYTVSAEGFLHPQVEELQTVTDQDGKYEFKDLPCNYLKKGADDSNVNPDDPTTIDPNLYVGEKYYVYKVKFDVPDSYGVTDKEKGDDRGKDSNINAEGETDPITLSVQHEEGNERKLAGEKNLTIDAGLVIAYSLGDRVWIDTNANGIQDPGEEGVPDTPVFLYKTDGAAREASASTEPYAHMLTDENGNYKFTNLPSGYYIVRFDISNVRKPGGYAYRYNFTKPGELGINNTESDAKIKVDEDGRIMETDVINLSDAGLNEGTKPGDGDIANRYDPRWDAGITVYSAISGFCFDDRDYDNIQSLMIPLAGTTVELYELDADGKPKATPAATTVTGSDGQYFFDHLVFPEAAKDYQIKFIYPDGYTGVDYTTDDLAKNSDVDVFGTDADGKADRTYGYISKVTVPQDAIVEHCDAGARKYAAIGDYVWNDSNKNGLQDDGEHPVPGVRVVLQERDSADGQWRYRQETQTNPQGFYQFTGLESSGDIGREYRVVFALDPNTKMTNTNTGTNTEIDSDASGTYINRIIPPLKGGSNTEGGFVTDSIKPGYGETDLTWDAGIIHDKVSVGDYVWYDDNYNGIQDDGEKGVPSVEVELEYNPTGEIADESKWLIYGRTETDADGYYVFRDLDPGYYRVKFKVPDGYRATRYNRGTGEHGKAVDSDAARGIGDGWYRSMHFYLAEDDMSWDAGIYKPQSRTERRTTTRFTDRTVRTAGSARSTRNARTGDVSNPAIWILIGAAALITAGGVLYKRNKKGKNKKGNNNKK